MCHEENSVSVYFPPISNLINLCTDVNPEENCVYTIPTTSLRTYLGVLTCPTCPLMNQCGSVDVYPGEYCVNLPYLSTYNQCRCVDVYPEKYCVNLPHLST